MDEDEHSKLKDCIKNKDEDSLLGLLTCLFRRGRLQEKEPGLFSEEREMEYYPFWQVIIGAINSKLKKYNLRLDYNFTEDGVKFLKPIEVPYLKVPLPLGNNSKVNEQLLLAYHLLETNQYDAVLQRCDLALTRFLKVLIAIIFDKDLHGQSKDTSKSAGSLGSVLNFLEGAVKNLKEPPDQFLNLYSSQEIQLGTELAIEALEVLRRLFVTVEGRIPIFTGVKDERNLLSSAHDVDSYVMKYQAKYVLELTCSTIAFLREAFYLDKLEGIDDQESAKQDQNGAPSGTQNTQQSPTDDENPF